MTVRESIVADGWSSDRITIQFEQDWPGPAIVWYFEE